MAITLDTSVHNAVMNQAAGGNAPHVKPAPPLGQPFNEMPNASPRRVPLWKWLAVSVAFMGALGVVGFIIMSAVTGVPTQRTAATIAEAPSANAWPTVEAAPVVESVAIEVRPQALPTSATYYVPLTNPFEMKPGTQAQFMTVDGLRCVAVTESPDQVLGDFLKGNYTSCE